MKDKGTKQTSSKVFDLDQDFYFFLKTSQISLLCLLFAEKVEQIFLERSRAKRFCIWIKVEHLYSNHTKTDTKIHLIETNVRYKWIWMSVSVPICKVYILSWTSLRNLGHQSLNQDNNTMHKEAACGQFHLTQAHSEKHKYA